MIDVTTGKPMRVSTDGGVGPFLDLPVSQLDEVCGLLDGGGVYYWVEEGFISIDDGPEMATIEFGRKGDATRLQALLDGHTAPSREMSHELGG